MSLSYCGFGIPCKFSLSLYTVNPICTYCVYIYISILIYLFILMKLKPETLSPIYILNAITLSLGPRNVGEPFAGYSAPPRHSHNRRSWPWRACSSSGTRSTAARITRPCASATMECSINLPTSQIRSFISR